jgi:polar amino acid transport system substrate-binding protein
MRPRIAVTAIAAALALALTGCVNNSTAPSTDKPGSTVAVDAAAAALLPDAIKTSGKIQVGIDATYPPNEYKDDNGNPIGWDVELFDAVAAKLGVKVVYNVASFSSIIPSITGKKYDAGLSSFTDNPEREKQVDFVNYYQAGVLWASPTGKTVDPANACGLKVAVQATTYEDTDEVPAKSAACVAAGKDPITNVKFDGQDQATSAVILGQADAMSADSPVTAYAISKSAGKLQAAGASFEVAPYGVAIDKGSTLGAALQKAFQSIIDDGTYKAILDKWGVADGAITTATINAGANG